MKPNYLKQLLLLMVVALVSSCAPYPTEDDYLSDYDIVITNFAEGADFSSYQTYSLPDKIPFLTNGDGEEEYLDDVNATLANIIHSGLESNMLDLGYTKVDANSDPDLMLNVGVFSSVYNSIYDDPCWWYGYGSYWDWYPGWGWGYGDYWGGYPCYGYVSYSYAAGTMVVDIVDVSTSNLSEVDCPNNDCKLDVKWTGYIKGYASNYESSNQQRAANSVDQLFIQSPYLKK